MGRRPADPAPGTGGSEPFQGAFDDGFPVELGQRGHDAEEQPADRRACVDALLEHDEVHLVFLEPGRQVQQVLMVTADAPQPGDDHLVARLEPAEQLVKLRP